MQLVLVMGMLITEVMIQQHQLLTISSVDGYQPLLGKEDEETGASKWRRWCAILEGETNVDTAALECWPYHCTCHNATGIVKPAVH